MAGYIPRWYTCPKTVIQPSTNRARRALTSFMRRTPLTTTPRRQLDAMLACCMLSLSVRLSVRHKPVLYGNYWTNRAGAWHAGLLPLIRHCYKKFGYLQKLRYFPLGLCPKVRENFATASRSRCQQLVVVDNGRAC